MHSFTSGAHGAALPLSRITDEHLAKLLQIPLEDARDRRAELARQHEDEGWIRETLRKLPEAALAVLGLVVEHGGHIGADVLAEVTRASYGMTLDEVRAGIHAAAAHALLASVESHWGGHLLLLVSPAAALVAAEVADLDLAELPRGELAPGDGPGGRALLAACMALRHVDVKLTQAGRPHRAPIKRLAKAVGVTDDLLEELLVTAIAFGLLALEEDQEILRPDVERLLHAAEGRYPGCAVAEALSAAAERGPVSSGTVQRWLGRSPPSRALPVGATSFAHLPGFRTGTVGGVDAVGRDALGDRAAGHVTPNFEVFLPPESRFTDIVRVGGCGELVRIDRMMVWRLTKASVRRSVSAGVGASQILAALADASRTPVPQNVEAAVRDWAGGAITAALARGRVIAVDPAAADRVRAALADLDPREVAPGVFVVADDTSPESIQARLRRADVAGRAPLVPIGLDAPPSEARLGTGSPELRARIAAWRARRQRARATEAPRAAATTPGGASLHAGATPQGAPDHSDKVGLEALLGNLMRRLGPAPDLASFDVATLAIRTTLGKSRDPFARQLQRVLEDLRTRIASGEIDEAWLGAMLREQAPQPSPALAWVRDQIEWRLQLVVPEAPLALDLGGTVQRIRFSRMLQRGDTWLVLGEELETREAVAVPLARVTGFALIGGFAPAQARPGPAAASPDPETARAAATPHLPGHVRCPCGSGARYRDCCRP